MVESRHGGYDYQFVDTPLDIFLCKICHLPSKEPHLSVCCGHTFCKSCLDGMKQTKPHQRRGRSSFPKVSCPMCRSEDFSTVFNKQNKRSIKNLRVYCTNEDEGCDWQGEINDITGHLGNSSGCQFEEVRCSNDCDLLLQRQHLRSHVDNECPCREVHCQYCNVAGQHQFIMDEHVDECAKVPLPCPNNCGVDSILREDMDFHKTTCPLEEIECPNDCGEALQQQYLADHIKTACSCRKVNCQFCEISGEYRWIEGWHKKKCPKLPIPCPNECEAGSIPREDLEDHRQECPLEVIKCEYYIMGCHVTMTRKDRHMHKKEKMEEHLQLTKCKLMDAEEHYEAKISELESALQQNHALMNLLFGEWTIELSTKALQLSSGDQVLPVVVHMSEYTKKKEDNVDWYSDSFYTHKKGYKMQLNVVPNGYSEAKGTHLSVYLFLMEGPYDDKLRWPLDKTFKVTLLNQSSDTEHHSVTRSVNGGKRIISSDAKDVWQKVHFIKTFTLHSQYLKNDSLFFEVSKYR